MTSQDLATFLRAKGQAGNAVKALGTLIPSLVQLNSVLFQALDCQHQPEEPATNELFALAQLTSDLYHLRNLLTGNHIADKVELFSVHQENADTYTCITNHAGFKLLTVAEAAQEQA